MKNIWDRIETVLIGFAKRIFNLLLEVSILKKAYKGPKKLAFVSVTFVKLLVITMWVRCPVSTRFLLISYRKKTFFEFYWSYS